MMTSVNDPKQFLTTKVDEESTSMDDDISPIDPSAHRSRSRTTRSSAGSLNSNGTKRSKDISPCYVCGAKAYGYNFDQITCESCKAFFRRNALKPMDRFRCRNNNNCIVTSATRKRCKQCRLMKCFKVGMRKEWILTDEEKYRKREKVVRNRLLKKQVQFNSQSLSNNESKHSKPSNSTDTTISSLDQFEQSLTNRFQLIYMYQAPDQQLYERQEYLIHQLSNGYQHITRDYPQPNKFLDRNFIISQTDNIDLKLILVKDLTRELTQMTTLRLLNFFNLIPEFLLLNQQEKQKLLFQNMLTVFMFHGALTYNSHDDTFVDRTTNDQPYDAKYLLFVYGPKVYYNFIALARELTSVTCQNEKDQQSCEDAHRLFLLLMVVLLFSDTNQIHQHDNQQLKMKKIQQNYIDLTCRYLHDRYGLKVGRRMFKKLTQQLTGLQALCSTLANINLCEMADDEDRSSSISHNPSTEFNSTMISNRSHLNELQKENRAPIQSSTSDSNANSLTVRSSPSILTNTHVY